MHPKFLESASPRRIEVSVIHTDPKILNECSDAVRHHSSMKLAWSGSQQLWLDSAHVGNQSDVIVMSLGDKEANLLDLLGHDGEDTKIIVYDVAIPATLEHAVRRLGVDEYVTIKENNSEELIRLIEQLASIQQDSVSERSEVRALRDIEDVSEREAEILYFICNGVPRKEIANKLFIAETTVKFHLDKLRERYECQSVLQLAITLHKRGFFGIRGRMRGRGLGASL